MRTPNPLARTLRRTMTDFEVRLWANLRRNQLGGFHFRRQHTIGPYIADFACLDAKLVIELDGAQHGLEQERARDLHRDAYLA
jgi:very-short-patch-repair endonuclease